MKNATLAQGGVNPTQKALQRGKKEGFGISVQCFCVGAVEGVAAPSTSCNGLDVGGWVAPVSNSVICIYMGLLVY